MKKITLSQIMELTCNLTQAAEIAGLTIQGMKKAVERGELQAERLGREFLLLREDVLAWSKIPRKLGRPLKPKTE